MHIKSKLENYWYHYKWHTILAIFIAITLVVGVTQCANVTPYDQNCVLYCNRVIHDNGVLALEQELTGRIQDQDGDGTATFEISNVSYNKSQSTGIANAQKLLQLVSTCDHILYVVDKHGYEHLAEQELFGTYDFLPDQNHTAWNWNGSKLQHSLKDYNLPQDLYFCIRVVGDPKQQQDPDVQKRVQQAEDLVKKLIAEGPAPLTQSDTNP